ncbi:response regulator [Desulfobulbus sp.]|uniref:ATP-binding response regulator n=1 Tax=Desulfobulbus sp. TaxID=895 RepID=UPI00286EF77B|nr:response regulator [Desulfobulbus sp.]
MGDIHALVVDNSPVIRRLLEYVLVAEGCAVRLAENGLDALDRVAEQRPDIIFTDLIMPEIDGEKLSFIVRNTPELKDIFLVVLSGVALEDDEVIKRIEADMCIAKGPGSAMKAHIKAALDCFRANRRETGGIIHGLDGLFPREVTSELLLSKKHREVILARMAEGVVELNHQGRIVMANDAAIALLDEPEARILGRRLASLVSPVAGDRIMAWIERLRSQSELEPLSFPYDDPVRMGERQVTCNLVAVTEETTFFIVGILQDVTRRKLMEERQRHLEKELQRIRKLEAMSLMASGISHDFNNLMTIISGNVEMARYVGRDENVNHLLNEAVKAINLTTQLIRQFTTFSDNYLPQRSHVQLCGLIGAILEQELASTSIEFQVACNDDDLAMSADPILVGQVFSNLASNAVAVLDGKGRIEVTAERVDGGREAAAIGRHLPEGELVRIVFFDSGPGIAPSILDQVFDPYFSTKQKGAQKGMGLGLTIVHAIVKKHGGVVWIENPPEGGCAVRMYFPAQKAMAADPQARARKGAGLRILVMDDEEVMRTINKKMFEHFGCTVMLASSGEEAIELYRQQLAEGGRFDLALLDLVVHGGMGGLETARTIKAMDPKAALVAISGDSASEIMRNYGKHHFVAALAKPFSIDSVERLVDRFL